MVRSEKHAAWVYEGFCRNTADGNLTPHERYCHRRYVNLPLPQGDAVSARRPSSALNKAGPSLRGCLWFGRDRPTDEHLVLTGPPKSRKDQETIHPAPSSTAEAQYFKLPTERHTHLSRSRNETRNQRQRSNITIPNHRPTHVNVKWPRKKVSKSHPMPRERWAPDL